MYYVQGIQGMEQDNTFNELKPPELVNTLYIYTQCTWATRVTVLGLSVSLLPQATIVIPLASK